MKKLLPLIFASFFLVGVLFLNFKVASFAQTDQCSDPSTLDLSQIQDCLDNLSRARDQSVAATTGVQKQINGIKARVAQIEAEIPVKEKQIADGHAKLEKLMLGLNATIRNFYVNSQSVCTICELILSPNLSDFAQSQAREQAIINQDKIFITNAATLVKELQTQKADLQEEEAGLVTVKASLDKVVAQAQAYQATLNNQISSLSSRQSELLSQKYNSLGIPTTAYTTSNGCSSDISPYKDPGFSGTKFGFFTYGVYHRVGMNQYGAKGRADKGASYQSILSFYYPNTQVTSMDTSVSITVNGTNDYSQTFNNQTFSIEDYLKHIYEMPTDWNSEALKAQAIAARTYAMKAVTSGQTTVAPNQSFQEVKFEENTPAWKDAVSATSGQVLTSGGSPITAWFSSTAGGYTHNSGDVFGSSTNYTTTAADANGSVNSFSDLQNNAYDGPNYANSKWFYCDWGGRSGYNNTAWLKSDEVADIVNVIMLRQADSSTASHLSQPDGNIPDTWDANRVKQELQNRSITPFNSIDSVSVSADFGAGKTSSITLNGDAGSKSFSGDTFATYFDVRAPANIFIPCMKYNSDKSCATAPLFNVETR